MRNRNILALVAITVTLVTDLNAQTVRPTGNSLWYYTIGGGDPMMYYHQSNKTNLELSAGVEWNLFRGCSFDPHYAIVDTFNNLEQNIYGLADDVVDSAAAAFTGWGLSKIQENWPGLYDILSNGLYDAKESYQLSMKTCRDVQADLRAGRDPVDGWVSLTRKSSWAQASSEGENPVTAEREIEENAGNRGITWVGGERRGGRNADGSLQPPIETVSDIVEAGFIHLVGADGDSADGAGDETMENVTGDPNISRVFAEPEDAAEWAVAVIGEREIRTCQGCDRLTSKVGQGLRYQYRQEREVVDADMIEALNADTLTVEHLDNLSVPGMGIVVTQAIIKNLKDAPYEERLIMTNRLAGEIALARVMEKSLVVRDLMNAGSQEPNVAAAGDVAQAEINDSRQRLQSEIDAILFENEVRSKILTNTAGAIARRGTTRDTDPRVIDLLNPPGPDREMIDGGIKKD